MEENLEFLFTQQEISYIGMILAKEPYQNVVDIMDKIQNQVDEHTKNKEKQILEQHK